MKDFLNGHTVLRLNALYQILGVTTPQAALIAMNGRNQDSARAINVVYEGKEMAYWEPVPFDVWVGLPIRDEIDRVVHTSKIQLRCPTVIVTGYDKMPNRRFRPTKSVLLDLQKNICGLTGKKLTSKQANLEHKIPRSHGGKDTFSNLMAVDKRINSARGNKSYKEFGYKPLFHHREPAPVPAHYTIKNVSHPDWLIFLPE